MELREYIAPLRKWWWLILLSTLVAAAASYIAVSQQPPIYEAKTTLLIGNAINNPNPTGNEFWLSQQLAETYANIAQRQVVQDAVKTKLGLDWLPSYSAAPVPETQLLELTVVDSNPERAAIIANEVANELILQAPTGSQGESGERASFINKQLDELETNIDETNDEIVSKQGELAELFSAREIAEAQGQIAALEAKLNTLQNNYASLLASSSRGAVNQLRIIEQAVPASEPVGPDVVQTIIVAALIGLSLAIAAAYLLEYLDDTVKTPDDVRKVANLPTLTGIAEHRLENTWRYPVVSISQPRSPVAEAYRGLRTAVQFSSIDKPVRSVLITSASPSEGKSVTAANLAVVIAQAGHRVLLIDADLRRPTQHELFHLPHSYGLTNLLLEMPSNLEALQQVRATVRFEKAIIETAQQGLYLLPSGDIPPNPAELVGSAKMKMMLELMTKGFDFVIVDSPPTLAVTDAVVMSTRVDGAVLITKAGSTTRHQLKQATQRLEDVNANILGIVLNRVSNRTGGAYYDDYYRSSYYTKGEEPADGAAAIEGAKEATALKRTSLADLFGRP